MDKDGDGGGEGGGGKSDASLLDAASLFGAYWGRDGAAGAAAAQQQQQAAAAAQLFGFPGGAAARGYPPSSATLSVAASQAASLGLHPAASAAWWQMASHLAAQDYLARIQASGLNFPPLGDPYSALSALSGGSLGSLGSGGGKSSSKGSKGKVGERSGRNSSSSVGSSSSSKEKSPATGMGGSQNARSSYGFPKTSSPSMMHMSSPSQSSLAGMSLPPSLAGLNSLVSGGKSGGMPGPNNAGTSSKHGRKSSSKSPGSSGGGGSLKERELALLRGDLLLAQAAAQGAYQAAVVAATKGGKQNSSNPYGMNNPFGLSGSGSGSGLDKDRHSGMDSIANLPHTILSAALEGGDPSSVLGGVRLPPDTEIIKYTSSISGPKVRKPSGGSSRGRKKTISLDPPHVSVLPSSGSSLPPKRLKLESEYGGSNLSSAGQPLSAHSGSGSRDRVEVIRLPSRNDASTAQSALEDYSGLSRELLQSIASQSGLSLAALERQLAGPNPSGFNLGGKSLSGHATSSPADSSQPLDLGKNSCVSVASADEDAPLNLSLKPSANESTANSWDWSHVGGGGSDALSRLTSLSSSLSAPPPSSDRVSRRKPGAKPRRVIQESSLSPPPSHGLMMPTDDSPRPKSSGSEDSEMASSSLCAAGGGSSSSSREGRPRNLGRGVSKPKKNTVASLLAQSRALGLRPALAQQLLQEADLEKLKAVLGEASSFSEAQLSAAGAMSTDSEYVSDSDLCPSDSDASEVRDPLPASAKAGGRRRRGPGDDTTHLRVPLALGWKRDTVMKGLSRSGYIKGDVCYTPPEPHATARLRSVQELVSYLEKYPCPPLSQDNFSFSSRLLVGTFLQSAPPGLGLPTTNVDGVDYILMPEAEVAKRLEEARALTALGMGVGGASGGPRPLPPPPLDRRMELARQQQAARDAKRDATARGRQQARLVRELERSEKAEHAKREKEVRNQQMMEAKRKRQEEAEKLRMEEQTRKAQEREMKRQQAVMMKEQERERRRQHTALVRQLESRRRWEERERRKHQILMDRLLGKEKRMQERRHEMELLAELRRPQEDSTLSDQKPLPALNRIPGLKLSGEAMADIMMVFEFIHNFGQTLGFDMETLPTLNTLQMALLPDCCPDAEEELLTVLQHLLVCAIEDPGIPHPGRHTTLLGQAIRLGDINTGNISEILRIYLYANATGEVKALTGISQEREREKRVADHHQTEEEMRATCNSGGRNVQYYEHLRANPTYRLAELLRDKPFLALSSTAKARTLGHLCNELLQNRAVLRQIDASLEHLNQLRKERYLMEAKLRKLRGLHTRKQRAEATERQQTLALERMQRLVEESQGIDCKKGDVDGDTVMAPPIIKDNVSKQDNSCAALKDIDKPLVLDKDSITGDDSLMLSDAESEGTQPEEDEDKNLSSEELGRKLERLLKQSEQQLQSLTAGAHSLRATCYGQDRYWRRYWSLGKCGGIFVEGMESAQPEILAYHEALEAGERRKMDDDEKRKRDIDNVKRGRRSRARKGQKDKRLSSETPPEVARDVNVKTEDQIKSELELKSIKSELNLSDHTQIIKYEPNVRDGHCKVEGSPIKMEERYIQQQQNKQAEEMLDIEDSIPTAFLVQKPPLNKPLDLKGELALESDPCELDLSNSVESEPQVNNLDELKKLADSVSQKDVISETNSQSDSMESKDGLVVKTEVSAAVKEEEKQQVDLEMATLMLYNKMLEGKWFSILRREHALVANGTNGQVQPLQAEGTQSVTSSPEKSDKQPGEGLNGVNGGPLAVPSFYERTTTCAQVVMCQGHKWEVSNNLHLLSNPALLVTNPSQAIAMPSAPGTYADSSLTLSGLQQDVLDASLHVKYEDEPMDTSETKDEECEDNAEEKVVQDATANNIKAEIKRERDSWYYSSASWSGSASLGYAALTAYVSCDSPPPLQLSVEEGELLELCKVRGLPPKVEGNFVAKEMRHGWWRITDSDCLRELLECLHPRGVRERELQAALLSHPVLHSSIKLGTDLAATELSISNLDRVIALNGGYPGSDSLTAYSAKTARRLRQQVMQKVEALEEAVVAASIQMKGWRPTRTTTSPVPQDDGSPLVVLARARLAELEANIERRYLNPPLGHSTGDANIGAVLQAESHGATPTQSPSTGYSNQSSECGSVESKGVPRGLAIWREAVARCQSAAQVAMVLQALKSAIAWDRSVMTANCQFCLSGDSEDKLLICDGCDKGYHTYCFKPKMDKIPDGDWYCWECVNKATGERACIVCGGASGGGSSSGRGRLVPCALCARAYHQECHVPPLGKVPRGKWYCVNCIAKAPPKKPRSTSRKKDPRHSKESTLDGSDHQMVPSPAPSHASTSTTADDSSSVNYPTHPPTPLPPLCANPPAAPAPAPETSRTEYDDSCLSVSDTNNHVVGVNHIQDAMEVDQNENGVPEEHFQVEEPMVVEPENGSTGNGTPEIQQEQDTSEDQEQPKRTEQGSCVEGVTEDTALVVENNTMSGRQKKEKSAAKRLQKDLNMCKSLLEQMEMHQDSWPFLLPVNTKQFPTYRKVIRSPMDLSTIKRKLHDSSYKCKEEFCADVRQIFHNCEVFNEDESPVGRAGHNMRTYFEERWAL